MSLNFDDSIYILFFQIYLFVIILMLRTARDEINEVIFLFVKNGRFNFILAFVFENELLMSLLFDNVVIHEIHLIL